MTVVHRQSSDAGVILIALLWILTALSGIALSFSRESFVEVTAAKNAQSLESSYFIARAGIAATIYQMMERRTAPTVRSARFQDEPDPIELVIVSGNLGDGSYEVEIQDESGKININTASQEQLLKLARATGIPEEDAGVIADSILDWRDSDELHRFNGAENDYYETLNPPYKAKNGRFDTVEELLLVKGVTATYFYGYTDPTSEDTVTYKYGLSRYFTVNSGNQINVNYAPLPVLQSIPGMSTQVAQAIYDQRKIKPFKNMSEINRDLPMNLSAVTLPFLTTTQTDTYTLTAAAWTGKSKAKRVIRTIINLNQGGENALYQTLYWNENIPDYEGTRP